MKSIFGGYSDILPGSSDFGLYLTPTKRKRLAETLTSLRIPLEVNILNDRLNLWKWGFLFLNRRRNCWLDKTLPISAIFVVGSVKKQDIHNSACFITRQKAQFFLIIAQLKNHFKMKSFLKYFWEGVSSLRNKCIIYFLFYWFWGSGVKKCKRNWNEKILKKRVELCASLVTL